MCVCNKVYTWKNNTVFGFIFRKNKIHRDNGFLLYPL
uniref:Uncharacterized protein n=1 Tax=viral metagenome TaxID=1070528 RepID=A0A6C0DM70_9ZZZZ